MGSQENMKAPIWIVFGFQRRDRQGTQNSNTDTFCKLPVLQSQCKIGTEKFPDAGVLLKYDDDDYSQGYGQIKETFRALTKDDICQP